jgi:CRP-like cAMP-binding protein
VAVRDYYLERLGTVPMFRAYSKKELTLVGSRAEHLHFPVGKRLVVEGERGQELFVILDGEASVTTGRRRVATLRSGDHFGELALLDPAPRDATVTAITPLEALVIGRQEFAALLGEVPALSHKVMTAMARRLRETDNKLNQ